MTVKSLSKEEAKKIGGYDELVAEMKEEKDLNEMKADFIIPPSPPPEYSAAYLRIQERERIESDKQREADRIRKEGEIPITIDKEEEDDERIGSRSFSPTDTRVREQTGFEYRIANAKSDSDQLEDIRRRQAEINAIPAPDERQQGILAALIEAESDIVMTIIAKRDDKLDQY